MSADLIEYLIESCVENGHKSMHYIQKVAISWVENGVETISQAKEQAAAYSRNCYTVLNAFGIKNRGPASPNWNILINGLILMDFPPTSFRKPAAEQSLPHISQVLNMLTPFSQNGMNAIFII